MRLGPDRPASPLRRQLAWTAIFALVALGGAGLATGADRPASDAARPELTWRAELAARPLLERIEAQLALLEHELVELSAAARDTLSGLRALDPGRIDAALATGDASIERLEELVATLADLRAQQAAVIDDRRLSAASRALLSGTDEAIPAAAALPAEWTAAAVDAQHARHLLDALVRHDGLVFRATTAARQERFPEALDLLAQAETALLEADVVRDQLAAEVDVGTLDELLRRYREYDSALDALYSELAAGGTPDGEVLGELIAAVDRAQAALPASNDALQLVVAEATGESATQALVRIEDARGVVAAALAAGSPTDAR